MLGFLIQRLLQAFVVMVLISALVWVTRRVTRCLHHVCAVPKGANAGLAETARSSAASRAPGPTLPEMAR